MTVLGAGDALIVSELFRLAPSVGQIAIIVDTLRDKGIRFIPIIENIELDIRRIMVTRVNIARILGASWPTLQNFIKTSKVSRYGFKFSAI